MATHPHISNSAYSVSNLSLLLRTPLCLNHPPSSAWLKACEGSALRTMQAKAQLARQAEGDEAERAFLTDLVEEADVSKQRCRNH
jgi:hypothetical protein